MLWRINAAVLELLGGPLYTKLARRNGTIGPLFTTEHAIRWHYLPGTSGLQWFPR